jgi:hypothetical protein
MRVPIDLIADTKRVDYILQTDASSSVGGGGWIVSTSNPSVILRSAVIRWTSRELEIYDLGGIHINMLEFIAAAYLVIAWCDLLAFKKVLIRVDNAVAMKWVKTTRLSRGATGLDQFMNVFSMLCALQNIFIISEHVPGVLNTHADYLSRCASLQESWFVEAIREKRQSGVSARGAMSRKIFNDFANSPSRLPLQSVLSLVRALLGTLGKDSAECLR